MKILLKVLVILSLVSINTACDWLKWNPTYIDEEWVVEKVEYVSGSKIIIIHIQTINVLYGFEFNGDEKLESGFSFSSICSITDSDVFVTKESIPESNIIYFYIDKSLDPVVHKTMQFDTTRIFYKVRIEGETSLFKPSVIWRCKFITASMDITYVSP